MRSCDYALVKAVNLLKTPARLPGGGRSPLVAILGRHKPVGVLLLSFVLHATSTYAQAAGQTAGQVSTPVAQTQAADKPAETVASATPLAAPSMAGPLALASRRTIDGGPFGPLDISGVLSGFGVWQGHPAATDKPDRADISNGQLIVQRASGPVQFYVQASAYNLPALGSPFISTAKTVKDFYGPIPTAYLKVAPNSSVSFLVGELPTLIGAESTFSFQNMNIERGLLWNQENAIDRGVDVNYSKGKFASSLAWNDGFYSDRYNWLTGSISYSATSTDTLQAIAGGNLGHTGYATAATPLYQNNSSVYNLIYTHTAKRWTMQPYLQFTYVPVKMAIGIAHSASTEGAAVLGTYTLAHGMSMAGRAEFIASTGSVAGGTPNLLYGAGSRAWSITLTPTYQNKAFFARGEFSFVQADRSSTGDAFGPFGRNTGQARAMLETGFIF